MNPLTCLLVDDEPLIRAQLRGLLEEEPGVVVLGEAGRNQEARDRIATLRPQLLFLDIQMPGGGGFELLHGLDAPPAVVFVTAHEEHAIRAFEVNAIDYLLKPVDPSRLHACIKKVRLALSVAAVDPGLVPLGESGHFIAARDILCIEANGHYSRVVLDGDKSHLVRQSLRSLGERLPEQLFLQLDRSLIINRTRITSYAHGLRCAELWLDGLAAPLVLGAVAAKRLRQQLPVMCDEAGP
jgi:two-component system LytT family response regulator